MPFLEDILRVSSVKIQMFGKLPKFTKSNLAVAEENKIWQGSWKQDNDSNFAVRSSTLMRDSDEENISNIS